MKTILFTLFFFLLLSTVLAQKQIFISDFDDTYKITHARKPLQALYNIFFTEKDFVGNDSLYAYLQKHDSLIILSNSPKFLGRKISRQLKHDHVYSFGLVLKPLFKRGKDFKLAQIRKIITDNCQMRFILIGDNGQKDPIIYQGIEKEFSKQIEGIYIHKVVEKNELEGINYYASPKELSLEIGKNK